MAHTYIINVRGYTEILPSHLFVDGVCGSSYVGIDLYSLASGHPINTMMTSVSFGHKFCHAKERFLLNPQPCAQTAHEPIDHTFLAEIFFSSKYYFVPVIIFSYDSAMQTTYI